VKHYHIKKTDTGQFCVSDNHPFDSLAELVVFHKHEDCGNNFVFVEHHTADVVVVMVIVKVTKVVQVYLFYQ